MTITRSSKKLAALAVVPFVAVLALSGCGSDDDNNVSDGASNVNIEPVESQAVPNEASDDETNGTEDAADANRETTETSFVLNQAGIETSMTYTAIGDEVIKQSTSTVIDYEASGLGSKEQAREVFDPLIAEAQGVEGYEHSIEYGETAATEEMVLDLAVADLEEISQIPAAGMSLEEGDYISLEHSRQMLEQTGFTEVE